MLTLQPLTDRQLDELAARTPKMNGKGDRIISDKDFCALVASAGIANELQKRDVRHAKRVLRESGGR